MKIIELYVENFGKLSGYRKSFGNGLNAFLEDNGFGKSTLAAFIKAMLYGLDDSRKSSLDENDRKKYSPWQGGAFGGWLVFESCGKQYRVERSFAQKASDDSFVLYDLEVGSRSEDFGENLGEELFGIDKDGFERTVFLSERNISGKNTNQSISAKLSNLVGVEGDIGGFDGAIKLLDERRKFYQKKGGSGEIHDLSSQMLATEAEVDNLKAKKSSSAEYEKRIADASERIRTLKKNKEELLGKQRGLAAERERLAREKRYSDMIAALDGDIARQAELDKFFEKKMPAYHEISAANDSILEISRLEGALADTGASSELIKLERVFSGGESEDDCLRMAALANNIRDERARLADGSRSSEPPPCPFRRIPTEEEIEHASASINNRRAGKRPRSATILFASLIFILLGVVLGYLLTPMLYSVAILGILPIFIVIFRSFGGNKTDKSGKVGFSTDDFISEIYGNGADFDSPIAALITMRADLEKYNLEKKMADERAAALTALSKEIEENERVLREFLSRFSEVSAPSEAEAAEHILRLRRRYGMLLDSDAQSNEKRIKIRERIAELRDSLNRFTGNFNTITDEPINEIRFKLTEYELIKSSLAKRRLEAHNYALEHGIDESAAQSASKQSAELESDSELAARISMLDEELIEAERGKTKLENEYYAILREVEKIDELEQRIVEYKEKIDIYTQNLAVITKAKELLAEAKSNMTARYLGPTKQAFLRYIELIDESTGEYTMDTSFTVNKLDMGKSRQTEAYSRGTQDLYTLGLRLALIDSLYQDEKPPIILDDPFTSFDDTHAERAISLLKKLARDRQIIYFTCSESRKA